MIRVDDIVDGLPEVSRQEAVEFELSNDEQVQLYALDAEIEDAAQYRRHGEMFEVRIDKTVPSTLVAALKRVWEAGGWVVGAFAEEQSFRLVFARPHRRQEKGNLPSQAVVAALEARKTAEEFRVPDEATIERLVSGRARTSTPLLIRMPTRSRPAQALEVLQRYREMATEHVAIEVIIDEDDSTCNNTQFLQRLAELDCVVTVGRHKSKIEACNAGRVDDWGVLMLASDDMWPAVRGYDQRILSAMEQYFPLLDGAINFNDGYNRDHVRPGEPVTCTLPIIGRYLYEQYDRKVYYPGYKSIYCDTDQTFLFNRMNRIAFVDEIIVEHKHFANSKARFDELYQFNSKHDDHDRSLFEDRRKRDFDKPQIVLSILICSIPSRRRQLERLVDYLRWQMSYVDQWTEICVDLDDSATVGEKRQRLLNRAVGEYVAFIDDDDWVDSKYIERVLKACNEQKDCCSLVGVITEDGINPRRFEHSHAHDGWFTREDGVYIRTPNHLNAVKRELALRVGFASKNVGEDHDFSKKIKPLILSEASTGEAALYYYWAMPSKSVQSVGGAR